MKPIGAIWTKTNFKGRFIQLGVQADRAVEVGEAEWVYSEHQCALHASSFAAAMGASYVAEERAAHEETKQTMQSASDGFTVILKRLESERDNARKESRLLMIACLAELLIIVGISVAHGVLV